MQTVLAYHEDAPTTESGTGDHNLATEHATLTFMELLKAIKNLLSHVATHIEKLDFPARFVYLEEYIPPEKLRGFRPTLLS